MENDKFEQIRKQDEEQEKAHDELRQIRINGFGRVANELREFVRELEEQGFNREEAIVLVAGYIPIRYMHIPQPQAQSPDLGDAMRAVFGGVAQEVESPPPGDTPDADR